MAAPGAAEESIAPQLDQRAITRCSTAVAGRCSSRTCRLVVMGVRFAAKRFRPRRSRIALAGGPERYGLFASNVLNCAAASFAACSLICDGSNPISGRTCSMQSSLAC